MSASTLRSESPRSVAPSKVAPANGSLEQSSVQRPPETGPAAQIDRNELRRRLLTVVVLTLCVGAAVVAVPDLRPVVRDIEQINPALVIAAVILELASCVSFVVIFRLF